MPRFDKTGPEGYGPRTGRQLGKCLKDTEETVAKAKDIVKKILDEKVELEE